MKVKTMEKEYERRQSVADVAYEAQGGVMLLKQRMNDHEVVCGQRYKALDDSFSELRGWLKSTFFLLLTGFGAVIFYMITKGH